MHVVTEQVIFHIGNLKIALFDTKYMQQMVFSVLFKNLLLTVRLVLLVFSTFTPTSSTLTMASHIYWPASDVLTELRVIFNEVPPLLPKVCPLGFIHFNIGCTTRLEISDTLHTKVCSLPAKTVKSAPVVRTGAGRASE